jgi:hypothetical protein
MAYLTFTLRCYKNLNLQGEEKYTIIYYHYMYIHTLKESEYPMVLNTISTLYIGFSFVIPLIQYTVENTHYKYTGVLHKSANS